MQTIEQRLASLEHEVAQIRLQIPERQAGENWVDQISGSMKKFPEFPEVVRLGREFRAAHELPSNEASSFQMDAAGW
jgi:hypothetical protein